MRFRIADIEREVLAALEIDFLSSAALQRAMEFFDKQQGAEAPAAPELSAALAEIYKRESDIREQFKAGKLPAAVFKSWLAEFAKLALRPNVANARFEGTLTLSHEEFIQEKQIDIKLGAGACFVFRTVLI
jgi:hypothetical protein